MTTSKFSVEYYKSTDTEDPKLSISLHASTWTYFKLFFLSLIGRPELMVHTLTSHETEGLCRLCARWKLVVYLKNKSMEGLADVATAPVLKTGER